MSKESRQRLKSESVIFVKPKYKLLYLHKREPTGKDSKLLETKVYKVEFLSTCLDCKSGRADKVGECRTKWCPEYEKRLTKPKLVKDKELEENIEVSTMAVINS